jgi:hypothetical protein
MSDDSPGGPLGDTAMLPSSTAMGRCAAAIIEVC